MLARIRKAQDEREGGFTLIELLVVIIIIGILAAIAIPTFLKQREKGWLAAVKSDVKNVATAEESYGTDNDGAYTTTGSLVRAEGYNASADVTVKVALITTSGTVTGFTLCGSHAKLSGKYVHYSSATGALTQDTTACTETAVV
jgi:type IV pilus assembly protein PilA